MKIFEVLKRTTSLLEDVEIDWALCGGVAACLYRETPRHTGDIDITLIAQKPDQEKEFAEQILLKLGFQPKAGWITDQSGKLIKKQALVIGRDERPGGYAGIDFILPVLPWVHNATIKAQNNLIDYGFAKLPTITKEDLIVAKLYALNGTPERKYDLDDILSILTANKNLDFSFIQSQVLEFQLSIPEEIEKVLS